MIFLLITLLVMAVSSIAIHFFEVSTVRRYLSSEAIVLALDYVQVIKKTNKISLDNGMEVVFENKEVYDFGVKGKRLINRGYVLKLKKEDIVIDREVVFSLDNTTKLHIGGSFSKEVNKALREIGMERREYLKSVQSA